MAGRVVYKLYILKRFCGGRSHHAIMATAHQVNRILKLGPPLCEPKDPRNWEHDSFSPLRMVAPFSSILFYKIIYNLLTTLHFTRLNTDQLLITTFSFVLFEITLALYNEKGKSCSRISYWTRPYTLLSRSLNFKVKNAYATITSSKLQIPKSPSIILTCYICFDSSIPFSINILILKISTLEVYWKFENQTSAIFLHCKCGKSNGTLQKQLGNKTF